MSILNVQFTDATETRIQSWFLSPQDPGKMENLGTVEADDPRWKAFYESVPEYMRQCFPAPVDVTAET